MKNKFNILVSIIGSREKDWQTKLKEIEDFKIREIALFLEKSSPLKLSTQLKNN